MGVWLGYSQEIGSLILNGSLTNSLYNISTSLHSLLSNDCLSTVDVGSFFFKPNHEAYIQEHAHNMLREARRFIFR